MRPVTILHTADWHAGAKSAFLASKSEKRSFEIFSTIQNILTLCRQKSVDLMLIAGDIFENNGVDAAFVDGILNAFQAIPDTRIVIACGNHDPLSDDHPFLSRNLPENVFLLKTRDDCLTFSDLSCRVYGRSFSGVYECGESRFSLEVPKDDWVNLMVLHGDLAADPSSPYNAVSAEFINQSGMDYIALGHIHKCSPLQKSPGGTVYAYCGCPEGMGFDESGEKGVYLGEVSKGKADLQFYKTGVRTLFADTLPLTEEEDAADAIDDYLNTHGQREQDLYRLKLTGTLREKPTVSKLLGRFEATCYFLKLKDLTRPVLNLSALESEPSLKGMFVQKMQKKIRECQDENERKNLEDALFYGLAAFEGEVKGLEDS